jgi:hypothetical protein
MYEVSYTYSDGKQYKIQGICAMFLDLVIAEIEQFAITFTVSFMEYPL